MSARLSIGILFFLLCLGQSLWARSIRFEFAGDTVQYEVSESFFQPFDNGLSAASVQAFNHSLEQSDWQNLVTGMLRTRGERHLSDWLYYQLIRRVAQQVSPKQDDYHRYTLYKWFLLSRSGYDATLSISSKHLLFYVQSNDNVYGIPFFEKEGKTYVCLNYHDYGKIDFSQETVERIPLSVPGAVGAFSYRISQLPDFRPEAYTERELQFSYRDKPYHFRVRLNPEIKTLFTNYPVGDFGTYFNIPLSRETHQSLIPALRDAVAGLDKADGVDYLMHFTRNAFLYENDQQHFGKEIRLSPEQTLLYEQSDCDDRAALFFYLVKEIYDLPMIALLFPTHVTIAVQFDRPVGKTVEYKGARYSVCEPTPMGKEMGVGELASHLRRKPYEVVYAYTPSVR